MPFLRSAFSRILEPLDRRVVNRIVAFHGGNRGVGNGDGAWTCQRHLKAMIFAHLAGLTSLRDMVEGLSAHSGGLYHVGLRPPKRTTLSDASARRPAMVFRDIALNLVREMVGDARGEGRELIRLIDGSPIPIRDGRYTWAESDARCRGLRLHLVYDPRAAHPVHFALEGVKTGEMTIAGQFDIEPGATYVFDKGYSDYGWWQDIVTAKAFFVTRLKGDAHRRDIRENVSQVHDDGIISDRKLKIGHKKPRGGTNNRLYETELREITVAREGKSPLRLITNDHERSSKEIADLYKERWQIELFFKWIKQNLKVKSFFGRSENAVRIQLYTALIAFCLLRLLHRTFTAAANGSVKTLLARIKVSLFDALDLSGRGTPLPRPPQLRSPTPQLSLKFETCI